MLRLSLILAFVIGLSLPLASHAQAQCPDKQETAALLSQAESHYVTREYQELAPLLDALLFPELCFESKDDAIEAFLLFGVAQFQLGEEGLAELAFLEMYRLDPELDVDAFIDVPNNVRGFIEEVRVENQEELQRLLALSGGGKSVVVETVYVTIQERDNIFWKNFMPFGVGQFQNEDYGWGITFLSLQTLAAATSISSYLMVEAIRRQDPDGNAVFTAAEAEDARNWQTAQLVSGAAFFVIYAAGVTHALFNYEDKVRVVLPPSREAPNEGNDDSEAWYLLPAAGPDGASVNFGLRF